MADPSYIDDDSALLDGEAWVGIGSTTLSSNTAVVTYTTGTGTANWSQYLDLILISHARSSYNGTGDSLKVRCNNDAGNNYSMIRMIGYGNGSKLSASYTFDAETSLPHGNIPAADSLTNAFAVSISHFSDINSGKYTTNSVRYAADEDHNNSEVGVYGNMWREISVLTELDIFTNGDLLAGSRFQLFGLLPRMVS